MLPASFSVQNCSQHPGSLHSPICFQVKSYTNDNLREILISKITGGYAGGFAFKFTYSEPNMNLLEIPMGGFVSSIFHCIFNTDIVMTNVNDDIKMFLTYLKTVYVKMRTFLVHFL